jgi:hypothetical protein
MRKKVLIMSITAKRSAVGLNTIATVILVTNLVSLINGVSFKRFLPLVKGLQTDVFCRHLTNGKNER